MTTNRLLVVDDDSATRYALRTIFTREGWDVAVAATLAEGLMALDAEPAPRCVILDLNLPDGGGEAILKAIRDRGMGSRVAVCSGTTDASRVASVLSMRPEMLLAKPYDIAPVMHLCAASRA